MTHRQAAAVRGVVLMLGGVFVPFVIPEPVGALAGLILVACGGIVAWMATLGAGPSERP